MHAKDASSKYLVHRCTSAMMRPGSRLQSRRRNRACVAAGVAKALQKCCRRRGPAGGVAAAAPPSGHRATCRCRLGRFSGALSLLVARSRLHSSPPSRPAASRLSRGSGKHVCLPRSVCLLMTCFASTLGASVPRLLATLVLPWECHLIVHTRTSILLHWLRTLQLHLFA